MKKYKLTDKQFDELEISTRRSLMIQLIMIHTPKYMYAVGAYGSDWLIVRYDRLESIGEDEWKDDYQPEVVDRWL